MAYNVFGIPITNSTLEGMPEYAGKTITRTDRARVALNMKNAQDKDFNARRHVEKLKEAWGDGVSTLCLVYNATGDTVTYATGYDWQGHIGPAPYPQEIANGQWGAYLHVKTSAAASGSSACVVYGGKNEAGDKCGWLVAWYNPWDRTSSDNKVYTEIRKLEHYKGDGDWSAVKNLLADSGKHTNDTWNGCFSTVAIGSYTSPVLEAIFKLENVD